MRKKGKPKGLGAVLKSWLDRQRLTPELERRTIELSWYEIVGARIAAHTSPRGVSKGVLQVVVSSSAWLNELNFLKGQLVDRINRQFKRKVIKEIRLVAGSVKPRRPRRRDVIRERVSRLSANERTAMSRRADAEIPSVTDDDLRQVIVAARRAQLERAKIQEKQDDEGRDKR